MFNSSCGRDRDDHASCGYFRSLPGSSRLGQYSGAESSGPDYCRGSALVAVVAPTIAALKQSTIIAYRMESMLLSTRCHLLELCRLVIGLHRLKLSAVMSIAPDCIVQTCAALYSVEFTISLLQSAWTMFFRLQCQYSVCALPLNSGVPDWTR